MKMPRIVATCLVISLFAALIEPPLWAQTSGDPGRWAYPLEAVLQSDPPLIGDFVPCIFDVDEHGSFRAIKVPGAEQNMQTAAQKAIQASSSLSEPQKTALVNGVSQLSLSLLSSQGRLQNLKKLTTSAIPNDADLADRVSNNIASVVQEASPVKRPTDVSCGMSVLPWTIARWSFGREIAENFIVVQVTVRNLNNNEQFLVHDVQLVVDTQPGVFNRFGSSIDQATIDGVALSAEELWSRSFWLRLATFVGSVTSAANIPISSTLFKNIVSTYNGAFVPALTKFFKDHTSEQIARLDSAAFTNSQSRKVIVSKNDAATFDTFLPVHSLQQIDWEKIYLYKTGAQKFDEKSGFVLPKKKYYKDWSPLAMLGLNNSTYVIVSGAHIIENAGQAQLSNIACPDNSTIDLTKASGDTVSCNIKGTNLQSVAQLVLENAQNSSDKAYAQGTVSVSGADSTQGSVAFSIKDLQALKGSSYKIFYATSKGGTPQPTALTITLEQIINLNPTSLTFSDQPLGTTSLAQAVAVTNRGTAALNITGVTPTGTNANDFTPVNGCGPALAAGQNCSISVTFQPKGTGPRTATLSISDNGPGNPHTVGLTGTGTAPAVTLSSPGLDFGKQAINTQSGPQTVTLTNSGTAPLHVSAITPMDANAGNYIRTDTCATTPVPPGGNCTITVTFKPTATGVLPATINIADDGPGSPHKVSLTGTGTAPALTLNPPKLDFDAQNLNTPSSPRTVTVTNSGDADLSISEIDLLSTDFSQVNTCTVPVSPKGTCNINVTFKPSDSGSRAAQIVIKDNASGNPHAVPLTGTSLASAVTLNPPSLNFAAQPINTAVTQTVTLTNSGNATLSIGGVTVSDSADFTQTHNCGTAVAAGASCTITVTFKPAATGPKTAAVTISDNAPGGAHTIPLSGSSQ
jgi:hypothetical protein